MVMVTSVARDLETNGKAQHGAPEVQGVSKLTVQLEYFLGVGSWMTCSVGMMLFNSQAVHAFNPACTLVGMQMIFTVFALLICGWHSIQIGSRSDVMRWSLVTPFFMGMLLTSILALKNAPMTLVITFRALSPLFAMVVERFVYPTPIKVSWFMIWCIVFMVMGAAIYATFIDIGGQHKELECKHWSLPCHRKAEAEEEEHRSKFIAGVSFAILNNFFAVGDRLMQRYMLAKEQNPVNISKSGCTVLNNALGLIPLLVVGLCMGEQTSVQPAFEKLDLMGYVWVILSCFVGCGISYTGVWVQSLISATSFMVLINANKFFIIFLEVFVLKKKEVTAMQVWGATITILASIAFGKAKALAEQEASGLLCASGKFEGETDESSEESADEETQCCT